MIPVLLNSTLLVVHTLVNSSEGMLLPELVPQCKESTTLALLKGAIFSCTV